MLNEGIYLGDSLRLLKRVAPESISLVLADPPYNISRKNNLETMGRRGIEFSWDGGFDQVAWLKSAVDTLMPGGAFVGFNDWKNLGEIANALKVLGMQVKRPIQWYKTNPIPRNKDRVPVQRMEYAVYAVKPGAKWTFNLGAAPTKLRRCCKPYLMADARYCGSCGRRIAAKGYEDGIFYHSIQKDILHPTKKPDDLWGDIIKVFSNEGDWVLDPFAGAGTLAIAGTRTNRKHISFDNDWLYVMWAKHLWKLEKNKKKKLVTV
jgi:site-specific DNA-methyltransferase (adenine-specific)